MTVSPSSFNEPGTHPKSLFANGSITVGDPAPPSTAATRVKWKMPLSKLSKPTTESRKPRTHSKTKSVPKSTVLVQSETEKPKPVPSGDDYEEDKDVSESEIKELLKGKGKCKESSAPAAKAPAPIVKGHVAHLKSGPAPSSKSFRPTSFLQQNTPPAVLAQ
ncbi:hypothetical protein DXG01_006631, partial [Tephrocybe rancida]